MRPRRARRLAARGPRGLSHCASHAGPKAHAERSRSYARFRVLPPHLSHAIVLPRCSSTYGTPRVLSPSAHSGGCVHVLSRGCLTRYVPPSGLLTLLTAFSATTPAGLFHPAHALGVHPFRVYSQGAAAPLGVRCPPDVPTFDPTRRAAHRQPPPNHGSNGALRYVRHRRSKAAAFRAFLPPETRIREAAV